METVTAISILNTMKGWVENKEPITADRWLEAAAKMNVLRGELDDNLFRIEHDLAVAKANLLASGDMTSAKADAVIKADDRYLMMRKANAQIKQLEEFIRIAKKQASLKNEEFIQNR